MCNIVKALNLALPVLLSYCYLAQFKRRISHVPNLIREMTARERRDMNQLNSTVAN